ncbi:MAG: YlxR family protein [Coriobacteriia bacterium]|nr:YlxR family protein [Coriobacteriia bacterium]MBS5478599.1 YlxR family protein [Coriobacteriia bacterium]
MAQIRERTCVACGQTGSKTTLVRFVRHADGTVDVDPTGRQPGRGAYLCAEQTCFDVAHKRHALDRALRVRIGEDGYARLGTEFDMLCVGHSDDVQ